MWAVLEDCVAAVLAGDCTESKSQLYTPSDLKSCFEVLTKQQNHTNDVLAWQFVVFGTSSSEPWLAVDEHDVP